MPNWCNNELQITGSQEDLEKFLIAAKLDESQIFSLKKLCPLTQMDIDNNLSNVNIWGTKWDVSLLNLEGEPSEEKLIFSFETAWSPPTEALKKISNDYPTLTFNILYYESGMDFFGVDKYQNGIEEKIYEDSYSNRFGINIENFDLSKLSIENLELNKLTLQYKVSSYNYPYDYETKEKDYAIVNVIYEKFPKKEDFEEMLSNSEYDSVNFPIQINKIEGNLDYDMSNHEYDLLQKIIEEYQNIVSTVKYNFLQNQIDKSFENNKHIIKRKKII